MHNLINFSHKKANLPPDMEIYEPYFLEIDM